MRNFTRVLQEFSAGQLKLTRNGRQIPKVRCRRGSYCHSCSPAPSPSLTTWGTGSLWLGLAVALIGAIAVAWYCERTLRALSWPRSRRSPAATAMPRCRTQIGGGALADSAVAAETMRQALIDADALAVDH